MNKWVVITQDGYTTTIEGCIESRSVQEAYMNFVESEFNGEQPPDMEIYVFSAENYLWAKSEDSLINFVDIQIGDEDV